LNEAETRAELIDPALREAGWGVVDGRRTRREVIAPGGLWQQDHLSAFRKMAGRVTIADPPAKLVPRLWAKATGMGESLPATRQTRASLLALAANDAVSTAAVCWSILAWGGMHGRHRDALHQQADYRWLRIAQEIRAGERTRRESYEVFADLRREQSLSGMGPAYFTKLIFFLMPRQSVHPVGYIMDQWVACSINLLAGRDIVLTDANFRWASVHKHRKLQSTFVVSDLNDGAAYEDYCCHIERLARELSQAPDATEWLMMSEGRGLGAWRRHVIEHRQPPHE